MGLFNDIVDEDRKIEHELYNFKPENREKVLNDFYGRCKEEFGGVDFGDEVNSNNNSSGSFIGLIVAIFIIIGFISC